MTFNWNFAKSLHRARLWLLPLVFALLLAGCTKAPPPQSELTGKVTFQGEPVTEGRVMFSNPTLGVNIIMPLDKSGKFLTRTADGKGLPRGEYTVCVIPPAIEFPPGPPPPEALKPKEYPNIPKRYRDAATSPLKVTVGEKPENVVLDMQDEKM